MFKFGFFDSSQETPGVKRISHKQWKNAQQISPLLQNFSNTEETCISHTFDGVTIKTVSVTDVIKNLKCAESNSSSILQAEFDHSDLLTAEYEGGLKIWECTNDLINYILQDNIDFTNKRVLDLGCGSGILGILALLKGASVDFQDYNKEVIEYATIPNVLLNIDYDEKKLKLCNFYCGDWKSFLDYLLKFYDSDRKYDLIFTSETIYNPDNYYKLHDIFSKMLKQDGITFLAAKSYYFGVGGCTREFEKHLREGGLLESTVCWKCSEGVQREILKIKKK